MNRGSMEISRPYVAPGAKQLRGGQEHTITICGAPDRVLNLKLESCGHAVAEYAALVGDDPEITEDIRRKYTFPSGYQERVIDDIVAAAAMVVRVRITPILGYARVDVDEGRLEYILDRDGEIAYGVTA